MGGGGRYDGLAEVLGGPPTPGVGFALGLERILLARGASGAEPERAQTERSCFVVAVGDAAGAKAAEVARLLRAAGVAAQTSLEPRPLKAQLRMADRAGVTFAVIIGDREIEQGVATVRRLEDGHQDTVPATDVVAWIARRP